MKKLLKLLTIFVIAFGFSDGVMAYVKPNGTFYSWDGTTSDKKDIFYKVGGSVSGKGTLYLISESTLTKNVSGKNTSYLKSGDEPCYVKNIPSSTAGVYFSDYKDTSAGSTLKKVWQDNYEDEGGSNKGNSYMAACYANSTASTNSKYYLLGFSNIPITVQDTDMYTGNTTTRKLSVCHNLSYARKGAYKFASNTNKNGENIKEKDYKYGFGKELKNITIGTSWACKGKGTSTFDECKGSSYENAKFTDRAQCPLYAGRKNDGYELYYFTDIYDSQFTDKKYQHLCVAYDADLETRIKNLLSDYKGKISEILDKYNDGDINFAKLTKQFNDKLNEMYVKMFNNEYVGNAISVKNGKLEFKDGVINHCKDYVNYINDELIDISDINDLIDQKIKSAQEAENLKSLTEEKSEETKKSYEMATQFLKTGFTGPGISDKDLNCEEMLGKNLTKILKFAIEVLSIAGAIIAIVNAMISLIPALIAKDGEALKKAQKKCVTMAIVLVLILLLPTLIVFIGRLFGYDLSCFSWLS